MNRYLLRISYMGTHFKAFTKTKKDGVKVEPTTIGVIEEALQELKPRNLIDVRTISRTDAGVHALNSAVVVDLERRNGDPYGCEHLTITLNKLFTESLHQVRINRTEIVPNTFNQHVNAVKSRTYLYRIGIIKKGLHIENRLEEKYRCYFLNADNFDVQKLIEAAQMFVGKHDFRTFMSINNDAHLRPSFAIREINYIKVEPSYARTVQPFDHGENVQYLDIIVNAQSFLYRQIRRMMGTLIAIACGHITKRDLYEMLTIPSQDLYTNRIRTVPAHALYLADIEFRQKCLSEDVYER